MKKTTLSVAIALLATSATTFAEEDNSFYGITPSASVALTTDYVWRGVSQTANAPAIQGSFDLSHESGLYAGAWASSIEFISGAGVHQTSMELDLYAGFSNDIDLAGTAITYDIGWLRYEYPTSDGSASASNFNFNELYAGLSVSPIENFNVSAYYYYGLKIENTLPGEYTDVAADYTLPDSLGAVTLSAHAGYYNQKGGGDDYWDWKIAASKEIAGYNMEIAYTDTDDSGAGTLDDSKIVATISRDFGAASNGGLSLPSGFETSASVALTTDYVWRGVSQTANAPAVQGSFDISHESGVYFGVWGSNVEFGGPDSSLELDIYAGFSNEVNLGGMGVTYDLGWLRYEYPTSDGSTTASGFNFNELYAGMSVSPVENLNVSAYYYYGLKIEHTLPGEYTDMAIDYTLPESLGSVTLAGHAGYYNIKGGGDDYWDWKLAVSKDIGIFNAEVAYTDTDDIGVGAGSTDDGKIVGTLSTSF